MKDQTADRYNEWHIGLFKNLTTGNWTWVNGKPLTLNKWQPNRPGEDDEYALMAKEFPPCINKVLPTYLYLPTCWFLWAIW